MAKTKIYSRFDRPAKPGLSGFSKTRTQQHFKDETDINKIIARAINTGDTTVFTTTQRAQYYDASSFESYQDSLNYIADIEDDFYSLPSKIRKEFGNSPEAYVAFMSNPANISKAVELGLLEGGEKVKPEVSHSGPSDPAGAPSETPAAAPQPDGHSST